MVQHFRGAHPNDYRLKYDKFTVQELITKENRKKYLVVKHQYYGDDIFEMLLGNTKLERLGSKYQFFNQSMRQSKLQHPPASNIYLLTSGDPEPVQNGEEIQVRPTPGHG